MKRVTSEKNTYSSMFILNLGKGKCVSLSSLLAEPAPCERLAVYRGEG